MLNNHNLFGADLDRFILPPPRGVSEELRKWLTEVCDLDDIAVRLIRLKGLKAQLAPPDATGASQPTLHPMRLHAWMVAWAFLTSPAGPCCGLDGCLRTDAPRHCVFSLQA